MFDPPPPPSAYKASSPSWPFNTSSPALAHSTSLPAKASIWSLSFEPVRLSGPLVPVQGLVVQSWATATPPLANITPSTMVARISTACRCLMKTILLSVADASFLSMAPTVQRPGHLSTSPSVFVHLPHGGFALLAAHGLRPLARTLT